jgi:hypothetical protein
MDIIAKRAYDRAYHAKRSPEAKAKKLLLQKERQRQILQAIRKHKAEIGCVDCGEKDPVVLEFDHLDPSTKIFEIGEATRMGWGLERILAEAKKCDVVCANCHRRRTAKQFWLGA